MPQKCNTRKVVLAYDDQCYLCVNALSKSASCIEFAKLKDHRPCKDFSGPDDILFVDAYENQCLFCWFKRKKDPECLKGETPPNNKRCSSFVIWENKNDGN